MEKRDLTFGEMMNTIGVVAVLLAIMGVGICFAVWGSADEGYHLVTMQAHSFAENFGDVSRIICVEESTINGYHPCTLFREAGNTTLIECTEKGCFIPNVASDLVLE